MDRYLIAFDLDGTVLPTETTVDPITVEVLKKAKAAGHIIFPTTARNFNMFKWLYDEIGLDTPVGLMNGAIVFNPTDDSFPVLRNEISAETVKKMATAAVDMNCISTFIEHGEKFWYREGEKNVYYSLRRQCSDPAIPLTADTIPDEPASRMTPTFANEEEMMRFKAIIDGDPSVFEKHWTYKSESNGVTRIRMSISPSKAEKWESVKYVAAYYGIPDENIYTFGDRWNDYLMVHSASHGFALKGSPAEKEADPRFVTRLTCKECGVADVILREILGEKGIGE